jgi:hypothetical protein
LIRRECKAEIAKLKTANSDVPVDLFVHCLTSAFFADLIWWVDRRSRLTPSQIDDVFRSLVIPTVHPLSGRRNKALILNFRFLFTPLNEVCKATVPGMKESEDVTVIPALGQSHD